MEPKRPVLREGFLVKQGHLVRNWKARWFVLTTDRLLYFKYAGSKRASTQRGEVMLRGCEVTCPYLEHDSRPLVFRLRTPSSVDHFLEACSREERDEWAAAISSAVEGLRQEGGGASHAQQEDHASSSTRQQQHLQDINLSQVVDQMFDVHGGIKMSDQVEQGSTFSNCFSGSAVVDWLVFSGAVLSRVEAVTLASALMEEDLLRPLGQRSAEALRTAGLGEQLLDDCSALYCFAESFKKRGSVKAETSLAAVELSGHVMRRGYLLKQGHQRKNWKVRLFVLRSEPAYLHYYDPSKNDIIPAGGFPLKGCLVSALQDNGVPSGVKGEVQGNLFKVITKANTHYYIQAPTNADKMGWIDAIRREI